MEFGPEIKVDGKRPEWLKDADIKAGYQEQCTFGEVWHSVTDSAWEYVESIRLPANHPHYITPTRTPLEDRMVTLCRAIAEAGTDDRVLRFEEARSEARAILAELEPVDPMLLEARQVVAGLYEGQGVAHLREQALSGEGDEWFHTKVAKAALLRGRQLQRDAERVRGEG